MPEYNEWVCSICGLAIECDYLMLCHIATAHMYYDINIVGEALPDPKCRLCLLDSLAPYKLVLNEQKQGYWPVAVIGQTEMRLPC